jgi:hypothetical protein
VVVVVAVVGRLCGCGVVAAPRAHVDKSDIDTGGDTRISKLSTRSKSRSIVPMTKTI